MPIQIPSYIKNQPPGSNVPNPSVHASPQNVNPNPKRSKIRMLLFLLALVLIGGAVGYYFFFYTNDSIENNVNIVVANSNEATLNSNAIQNINLNNSVNINSLSNTNGSQNPNTPVNLRPTSNLNISNTNVAVNLNTSVLIDETDSDGDGLTNNDEYLYGTNSELEDTDGDGYNDIIEVMTCYNPIGQGNITSNYIFDFCERILTQEMDEWSLKSSNEISTVCSIYKPAVELNIQMYINDTYSDDQFTSILSEKCDELRNEINQDDVSENNLCKYMGLMSMICI
ncbi:MAG: hypothetical protein ACNFW9_01440 [Candidatus Kerfeldbacteria bacterium]